MSSMFYESAFRRPFPVSFLLVETVAELLSAGGADEEAALRHAVATIAKAKATAEALHYVVARIRETDSASGGVTAVTRGPDRGFATSFQKWATELSPENVCLFVAQYDYTEARRLYCEIDKADVVMIAAAKIAEEWQRALLAYESAMYGFGGGYGEGDNDSVVHDANTEEGARALSDLFSRKH